MSGDLIIDKIFKMVCEEAGKRPGGDLVGNLSNVMGEVTQKVLEYMVYIELREREKPK